MPICPPMGSGFPDCYLLGHPSPQSHEELHFKDEETEAWKGYLFKGSQQISDMEGRVLI